MNGSEIAQIITSIATLVAAVGSVWAVVQSSRNARKIDINTTGIQEIKTATDGMKDQLVHVTGEKRYIEGVKHGEDHPRDGGEPVKVEIVKIPPLPGA